MRNSNLKALGIPTLLITTALTVSLTRVNADYLPIAGPAPLRIQKPKPIKRVVLPPLPKEESFVETSTPIPSTTSTDLNLTVPHGFSYPLFPTQSASDNGSSLMWQSSSNPTSQSYSNTTANDLLTVTPQMLVDYFRPIGVSSNGVAAGVSLPLIPVPFMPANPAPLPSSATYRVE